MINFVPTNQKMTNMTHQQNKQFNTYKEGLDLEFLREYCMEHGERRVMERGEMLGRRASWPEWLTYPISPIFVARYELQLPSKEKIRKFLMQENGNTKKWVEHNYL